MGFEGMEDRMFEIFIIKNKSYHYKNKLLKPYKASKHISFGTTTERPTFPNQIAHDRFGNEHNPFKGVKEL